MPQRIVHLASALQRIWALMLHLLALTARERKLTWLLFSLCAVVFSLVWLMQSIQTQLPWPLTPPTSGFPVYTMTTACMCGMSKTRRKWARCTLHCTTLPACGTLRYVVCRHKCWIASCSWGSPAKFECKHLLQGERIGSNFLLWLVRLLRGLSWELGTVHRLHCNGWPNALDAVCYWKKNILPLKGERWEKEQNWTKLNAPFTKCAEVYCWPKKKLFEVCGEQVLHIQKNETSGEISILMFLTYLPGHPELASQVAVIFQSL